MVVLVKLLGIVIVVFGVIYLVKPDMVKRYAAFWTKAKRIYIGAALNLVIGIILLLAASECAVSWVVTIFGLLSLAKGIMLFVLGPEKAIAKINWWVERPVGTMRLIGIMALALGALLIYAV